MHFWIQNKDGLCFEPSRDQLHLQRRLWLYPPGSRVVSEPGRYMSSDPPLPTFAKMPRAAKAA